MRSVGLVALCAVVSACAASSAPAPVDYRTSAAAPPPRPRLETTSLQGRPHPASAPPDWAEGPGTPLSAYALQPDEAQPIDPRAAPRAYAAQRGDTLFDISERFQIPLRSLIVTNNMEAPFAVSEGQIVRLPPPRLHRVQAGESLIGLARRYAIDARSLALLNRLEKPYVVREGDTLILPALARQAPPPPIRPTALADATPTRPAPATKSAPVVSSPRGEFAWPVRGPILARFGPQPGGRRSDGVDIGAALGAPIAAAADGRVVYAGDDLPGYGRLILIQHPNGWVTAYAHCGRFAVSEGVRIKRGEKIAEVGRTSSGKTLLHFQLRKGADPTDPMLTLPAV